MLSRALALVLVSVVSTITMQTPARRIAGPPPAPVGPYSPAVVAGGLIYLSGTLAQDATGTIGPRGDVAGQVRRVLERMRGVLEAAGSSLPQVVAVTVYLRSPGDFAAMNEAYRAYWPDAPPTRTTVVADLVLPDALVEVSMIAVPNGAERAVVHPKGWMKSPNPYSYAIRTGDTLFVSGLVSRNGRDNSVVTGDIVAQTRAVMDNAGEILEAASMSHANVVSNRVYLPDAGAFQQMNETYRRYFPTAPPARATVKAALTSPQYLVEMTMIASAAERRVIDDGRPANPNLSAAIAAGRHVYLSGMLDTRAETRGDVAGQTRQTLARIGGALAAAGVTPADVVDALVYLPNLKDFQAMNGVYREFFTKDFPARATVGTGLMSADPLVEIMVTAVRP